MATNAVSASASAPCASPRTSTCNRSIIVQMVIEKQMKAKWLVMGHLAFSFGITFIAYCK